MCACKRDQRRYAIRSTSNVSTINTHMHTLRIKVHIFWPCTKVIYIRILLYIGLLMVLLPFLFIVTLTVGFDFSAIPSWFIVCLLQRSFRREKHWILLCASAHVQCVCVVRGQSASKSFFPIIWSADFLFGYFSFVLHYVLCRWTWLH